MDIQQQVETILKVIDQATGPLRKIAAGAEKTQETLKAAEGVGAGFTNKLFNGLKEVAGIAGVVGGALAFKAAWDTSEKYIKNIKEIRDLTGATASETDFLFSSARKAGVEYDQMKGVMFQLSRRGSQLEQSMGLAGQQTSGMAKRMSRLGVDMTKGPVNALAQMSAGVKSGKIDAGELMSQFRIPPGAVNDFKGFLERLDKSKLAAAKGGGAGLISDREVDAFDSLESAQHRIADSWNRIKVTVVSKLMPVAAKFAEDFAARMESVIPKVQSFASFLAKHMDHIVLAAKAFVAYMTSKQLLVMLGPGGMVGKLAAGGIGGLLGKTGGAGAGLFALLGPAVNTLMRATPVLAAIGAAVWVVVQGYKNIMGNVDGVRDRINTLLLSIKARFSLIGDTLNGLWQSVSGLFGNGGTFTQFVGSLAASGIEKVIAGFDHFVHVIQTVISMSGELADQLKYIWKDVLAEPFVRAMKWVGEAVGWVTAKVIHLYNTAAGFMGRQKIDTSKSPVFEMLKLPVDMFKKHWDKTQGETGNRMAGLAYEESLKKRDTAGEKKPPATIYDFRGSRFDITQNFAEGFDPDRIAVAFSEDLSALGEHRVQSSFAPAFAAGR